MLEVIKTYRGKCEGCDKKKVIGLCNIRRIGEMPNFVVMCSTCLKKAAREIANKEEE